MSSLKFNVLFFAIVILFMVGISTLIVAFTVFSGGNIFWGIVTFLLSCLFIAGAFVLLRKI